MNNKIVYGWFADGLPFYIGIGSVKRSKTRKHRNLYCLNKRDKAERENCFEIRILYSGLTKEQACEIECQLIKQYGRIDNGTGILTNMTDGGEGGSPLKGKNHSQETKEKISKAHKGKIHSKEHIENNRKAKIGTKHSEKTRKQMSKDRKGVKNSGQFKPQPVMVENTLYESATLAGKILGQTPQKILQRCNSKLDKFKNYKRI